MFWAVGDIHGEAGLLRRMLDDLRGVLAEGDTLVFLGDYIDRGADSKAVIDTLLELQCERPRTVFLRGNHEQMMLDARDEGPPARSPQFGGRGRGPHTDLWFMNGGVEALASYGARDLDRWPTSVPDAHWAFVEATQMEFETEGYHFVHAGLLPPGRSWEGEPYGLDPRLWIRDPFLVSAHDFGGKLVVFGHTPQQDGRPLLMPNKLGIDTGAVFGGPLTAVELPEPRPADLETLRMLQTAPEGAR